MARGNGRGGSKRRKRQADIEDAVADAAAEDQRKNSDLNDDERHALHLRHVREYQVGLAAKKKADAELKNVGKRIKAEGDSVAKVKKTILAQTPEGEAELRAEMEETLQVLRWSGVHTGETKDMFPDDRTPAVDRARAEGKRAGMDGQACSPNYDPSVPQHAAWIEGWQEGQAILASAFAKKPEPDPLSGETAADLDAAAAAADSLAEPSAEGAAVH